MSSKKVIIIGPAHPLRGGLASFDQRLCQQFTDEGWEASIFSFSLQYPSFLFPGTTQYSSDPAPAGIKIFSIINSVNPFNWIQVGNQLRELKPDLIVVRYWLPFMGPALGTILRRAKKNKTTRIVAITDNVIPHEKRPGDVAFTKYFLKSCDGFITMSEKVMSDLRQFETVKPAAQVVHPLYDNFGAPIDRQEARIALGLKADERILLFFGFIRKYKGLDLLLQAVKLLHQQQFKPNGQEFKVMIAGEFYEDRNNYQELLSDPEINAHLILRTDFIPDSQVKNYLCAADVVIQPYRNATQSGVTPLAYHFEKPMIVTNVGGLPGLVPHEAAGLVTEPEPGAIAAMIERFFELGGNYFLPHLRNEKAKYSWHNLVLAIDQVAEKGETR